MTSSQVSSKDRVLAGAHWAVIAIGALLITICACHSNLWYDEAFSVAIVQHSLSEIWSISADDVHPVLYYVLLKGVYDLFGLNIVAMRIFSVLGIVVLSLLGWTHVRRYAGAKTGLIFSVLAYMLPWSVRIALQIRMYSWLAVTIMLVALYAWRIAAETVRNSSGATSSKSEIRLHWWVVLFLASIASAYLQYYGAIAAFAIQAILVIVLIKYRAGTRALVTWVVGAAISVLAYVPWLTAVVSQVSMVSSGQYWIQFGLMSTPNELLLFPFNPPEMDHVSYFGYHQVALTAALCVCAVAFCVVSLYSFGKAKGNSEDNKTSSGIVVRSIASFCFVSYVATVLVVFAASLLIGHAVLYYRYLTVCIGPLALAMAYVFARTDKPVIGYVTVALIVACGLATMHSAKDFAEAGKNQEALDLYGNSCAKAAELADGRDVIGISSDSYVSTIIAADGTDLPIHYVSDIPNVALRAFEPNFVIGETYDDLLYDYDGVVVFLGKEEQAKELAERYGGTILDHKNAYHMYSTQWFDTFLIDFD